MVTGTIFKGLTFDGVDSTQYGVYITGEAVYNAPMRDVEMIEIPGRNGAYALDKGRFTNIEVTYPAGIYGKDESEFAQAISDFRNALCSRKGYCRLTDGYNSNEYRMAVYSSGLEVSPAQLKAGQFDITFECKPQRFLTSGETEQTVTSGATITNPTLFDSHPLLLVDGYGDININDDVISIQQGSVMGDTEFATTDVSSQSTSASQLTVTLSRTSEDLSAISLNGDTITMGNATVNVQLSAPGTVSSFSATLSSATNIEYLNGSFLNRKVVFNLLVKGITFSVGTASSGQEQATLTYSATVGGEAKSGTITINVNWSYDGNNLFVTSVSISAPANQSPLTLPVGSFTNIQPCHVDSTKSALGQLYIDLDIGECYRIENGQYISINTATILPADLPTFNPGTNTITYDNTFTSFKVTPRWWKV